MSGVRVHTSSPINANTSGSEETAHQVPIATPASAAATTTTDSHSVTTTARPQAAAFPAPTPSAQIAIPTPTTTRPPPASQTSDHPPAPQPGAAPVAWATALNKPTVPPPPKAGETPGPASYYPPQYTGGPSAGPAQASVAPLPLDPHQPIPHLITQTRAQPPASTTSTEPNLSHPPGYIQDSQTSFRDQPIEPYQPFASSSNQSQGTNTGLLGGVDQDGQGIWETAVSWAKTAGEKLSQGEQQIWKVINGEK